MPWGGDGVESTSRVWGAGRGLSCLGWLMVSMPRAPGVMGTRKTQERAPNCGGGTQWSQRPHHPSHHLLTDLLAFSICQSLQRPSISRKTP